MHEYIHHNATTPPPNQQYVRAIYKWAFSWTRSGILDTLFLCSAGKETVQSRENLWEKGDLGACFPRKHSKLKCTQSGVSHSKHSNASRDSPPLHQKNRYFMPFSVYIPSVTELIIHYKMLWISSVKLLSKAVQLLWWFPFACVWANLWRSFVDSSSCNNAYCAGMSVFHLKLTHSFLSNLSEA